MLRLDWNSICIAINILVLYLLMRKFLFGPISRVIAKRQDAITKNLADADLAKSEAYQLKEGYEQSIQQVGQEKDKVMSDAKTAAAAEYDRIVEEAKSQAESIVIDAKRSAEAERAQIISQTRRELADMVVTVTAKVMGMGDGLTSDEALYNQFLKKAGEEIDAAGS